MRKRVKKQLEAAREVEREQYRDMREKSHQLYLEITQLQKTLRISEEREKKLSAMFEQLQTEYEELETAKEDMKSYADELNDTICSLIDESKQSWWRKLLDWLKNHKGGEDAQE